MTQVICSNIIYIYMYILHRLYLHRCVEKNFNLRFGDLEQPPWQQWHSNLAFANRYTGVIPIGSMHGIVIYIY